MRGERVIIGDEIKRFALVLQRDSGTHRPEIVSDMEGAGGLDARKDAHGVRKRTFNSLP